MTEKIKEVERSIITTYKKDIWKKFTSALNEYELIQDGDKIGVCMSGGKDSFLLAKLFQELKKHGKNNFELEFIVMDPGYNKINREKIEENAKLTGIPIKIFDAKIFDYVEKMEKNPCYMCARMRRGHLYAFAKELGCNKIALGHHFDDAIETTLMTMFYAGEFRTMMPKLKSTNFEGMELIRPMYKIREKYIINWMKKNNLTFINCACKFTEVCSLENTSKRKEIKELVKTLEKVNETIPDNIFTSLKNVNLNTILGYKKDGERHFFLEEYED